MLAIILAATIKLAPSGTDDMSAKLISSVASGNEVVLAEGTYHFYSESAKKDSFYVSNHDQPNPRTVQLPICGVTNFTLRANGSGAKFIFHGESMGILLRDTKKVTLKNISLDWEVPTISEFKIGTGWTVKGCYGEAPIRMLWDGATKSIKPNTGDSFKPELGKDGDYISYRSGRRPEPAICLYRAEKTVLKDVVIHSAHGMGILGQRSADIAIIGGGVYPREGSICSTTADATHFSNCRGKIVCKGARFTGMMDDAINVHSTCLRIEEKLGENKIRCRYVHGQSIGFEVFQPGEALRFIKAETLENGPRVEVTAVEQPDARTAIITLKNGKALAQYEVGDAVENANWQPSVTFTDNYVGCNRARGTLFTTPKPVLVENNTFEHVSGTAILLAGDASGWYESGACQDVTIRGNKFIDCLTSQYQFCTAVITAYPMVRKLDAQKKAYHANITVENNEFKCGNAKLQAWISTDNIVWKNNKEK